MKIDIELKCARYVKLTKIFMLILSSACGLTSIFAQNTFPEAKITRIATTTTDLIEVQASVSADTFQRGDDIPIYYSVKNRSEKPVYLVTEPHSSVIVEDLSILRLIPPVRGVYDHVDYNYDLIKVSPHKVYRGKLLISSQHYLENKKYDFSIARIQVGFSYIFDRSGLEGCERATYVRPCFSELYNKSRSLILGNFVVEIKNAQNG